MRFRRRIFHPLLLAFALLFAQAGSMAHGITHIMDGRAQRSEHSLPHDKYCGQCATYAQIGGAVGSSPFGIAVSASCETLNLNHFSSHPSGTFAAFAARAPPDSPV